MRISPDPRKSLQRALTGISLGDAPRIQQAVADVLADRIQDPTGDVIDCLTSEITDVLRSMDSVSLVATGLGWLGGGVGAIESAILDAVRAAELEVQIAAYSLTMGAERLWGLLKTELDAGIRCTLIADRLSDQDPQVVSVVRRLCRRPTNPLQAFDFHGQDQLDHLHAKLVVVDRSRAIVGSANLTAHGMMLAHELAVVVDGQSADEIASRLDMLARSGLVTAFS